MVRNEARKRSAKIIVEISLSHDSIIHNLVLDEIKIRSICYFRE